jgi:Uma2 family endonuclease
MALPQSQDTYTVEEYLAFEREAEFKHEYADGEIVAMTGASNNHNLVTANLIIAFGNALRDSPCTVRPSDMRIHLAQSKRFRYPDVSITCEEPQFDDNNPPSLLNPTVIIEVLSPSTEIIDRNTKLDEYRAIPSLQAYLLVSQDEAKVEYYLRDPNSPDWRYNAVTDMTGSVTLPNPACTLTLAEVYRKVTFETPDGSET